MTAAQARENLNNAVRYNDRNGAISGMYKLVALIIKKNDKGEIFAQAEIRELFHEHFYYVSVCDLEVIK